MGGSAERHADVRERQFDCLYQGHRQALHAFLLGRTGDPELALDLLQEAFVRAWRNLDTLRALADSRQRAWLFTTARNLVIDQHRGRVTRTAAQDALEATMGPAETISEGPELTVERDHQQRLLDRAIRRLPDELRTVLVLQVIGDKTSAEIGELLDRPAGTVRYQLSRARKRLTQVLRLLEDAPDADLDVPPGLDSPVGLDSALPREV
jgi:RNA polymerase sigma-70 factor (ECF subfamily)